MRFPEWIKNPHGYFIISLLILLATLATWLLPAGEYQRVKDPHSGKTVVDPASYAIVESQPVNPFKMLQAIPRDSARALASSPSCFSSLEQFRSFAPQGHSMRESSPR
jgi:uncharacterized ion transporter superfamily protein YfcC